MSSSDSHKRVINSQNKKNSLFLNKKLFTIGHFEFYLHHLLIVGVLSLSFSISAIIRGQPAEYGYQLNEFDPYFNYRATKFLVDNGIQEYFQWHDELSWYPMGRDVVQTSQVMLHITAAMLYGIFGGNLYEFTIIFPLVIGSLTTIIIFALVRVIGGTTAGLYASLMYSVSLPVITRGSLGWFKSEPLGLFYGLLATYLFLSGIKSASHKIAAVKLFGGGIFLGFAFSAWGGTDFFVIPLGFFILSLPFTRKDTKNLRWLIPLFVLGLALSLSPLERPGIEFFGKASGLLIIGPTLFLIASSFISRIIDEQKSLRYTGLFLIGIIILGIVTLLSGVFDLPSFRYLNAINPFLTTIDPLVDSVAEHSTTNIFQSFLFNSVFMLFAGIGTWLIFKNINNQMNQQRDLQIFVLIFGILGVYISSAFIRLELFSSIALTILGSIGLGFLTKEIFKSQRQENKKLIKSHSKKIKISFLIAITILLIIPLILPSNTNWVNAAKTPPTILNGGSNYNIATNDWLDAMTWLKENTPDDSVVASWWDYGYWISTLAERKTLADNATIDTLRIQKIAQAFLSTPEVGWTKLNEMNADYVLIYVAAQRVNSEEPGLFFLDGGGDESKKQWFMRIGGFDTNQFLFDDGISATPEFWDNTLLGKMIPFSVYGYVDLVNQKQSGTYSPGFKAVYHQKINYEENDNNPLRLVYTSSGLLRKDSGPINGVIIYEINKNYKPFESLSAQSKEISTSESNSKSVNPIATISTNFGDIVFELNPDVAPNTVTNFVKLANSKFYDGTLFHRIISTFVIQGGDPNTKDQPPGTWGMGGPGYTIDAEISNLKHTKYVVSMARGAELNSAGSQFFIMTGDAPFLDGKYTIFGKVIKGQDVVDKISSLKTDLNDRPIDFEAARIKSIRIS